MKIKLYLFIILLLSCTKSNPIDIVNVIEENKNIIDASELPTLYVFSSKGLNLRSEPSTNGTIIKLLQHNCTA